MHDHKPIYYIKKEFERTAGEWYQLKEKIELVEHGAAKLYKEKKALVTYLESQVCPQVTVNYKCISLDI